MSPPMVFIVALVTAVVVVDSLRVKCLQSSRAAIFLRNVGRCFALAPTAQRQADAEETCARGFDDMLDGRLAIVASANLSARLAFTNRQLRVRWFVRVGFFNDNGTYEWRDTRDGHGACVV